jgi:hypothetical protein
MPPVRGAKMPTARQAGFRYASTTAAERTCLTGGIARSHGPSGRAVVCAPPAPRCMPPGPRRFHCPPTDSAIWLTIRGPNAPRS